MPNKTLREAANRIWPYPAGVIPIGEEIPLTAFFPAGTGLWRSEGAADPPVFPEGGIMILGHDFHSDEGYEKCLNRTKNGEDDIDGPTWKNLRSILREVGVQEEHCFFTNFYVGVRKGRTATGPFPGRKDASFVRHCLELFVLQVEVQQPKAILILGKEVPPLIAPLSSSLERWTDVRTFADIDSAGPMKRQVTFGTAKACSVVVLTHPCLRALNVRRRRYGKNLEGYAAEERMILDALGGL